MHEKEYNSTLEFLDWTSGMDIALEYRHPLQPERWCRSSGKKKGEAWRDFEPGDEVDALDTQNKWQAAHHTHTLRYALHSACIAVVLADDSGRVSAALLS